MNPADDPTSIGNILISMGAVDETELEEALEKQEEISREELLGIILVAQGAISREQLEVALSAQQGMRSREIERQATAHATVAREGVRRVAYLAAEVRRQSEITRKSITGGSYQAVGLKIKDET